MRSPSSVPFSRISGGTWTGMTWPSPCPVSSSARTSAPGVPVTSTTVAVSIDIPSATSGWEPTGVSPVGHIHTSPTRVAGSSGTTIAASTTRARRAWSGGSCAGVWSRMWVWVIGANLTRPVAPPAARHPAGALRQTHCAPVDATVRPVDGAHGGPTGARCVRRPQAAAAVRRSGADEALGEVAAHLAEGHALLAHGVAVADRHGLVLEGVEVHRHAQRRADLVLAAVTTAHGTGVVEVDVPVLAQLGGEVPGHRGELLVAGQRQHRGLDRRQARVELEHGALVDPALGVGGLVLAVGLDEEGHQRAAEARGGLDHAGHLALVLGLVDVGQAVARVLGVRLEDEGGAVGAALELAPLAVGEAE